MITGEIASVRPGDTACDHAPATRPLFEADDYISGERFSVELCPACGLARTQPQPATALIPDYYPPGYYGVAKRYPAFLEWLLDRLYGRRVARLEQLAGGRPGRVVEVGCGRGLLLDKLRRRGWDVVGSELSAHSAGYARDILGIDVRTCDLPEMGLPASSVDLVILWHVLEHIPEPAHLLREVAKLLRPGGTVVVAVPNFGSIEAAIAGPRWFHLDVPRHLTHFTRHSLEAMLRQAGLTPGPISYFAPEYDLFSFVQSLENRLGLAHNLLYDLLRTRDGKVLRADKRSAITGAQRAAAVMLAPPLALLGAFWIPVATVMRLGATMTIVGRRM
jgi:SAM-dependent methyltransferase